MNCRYTFFSGKTCGKAAWNDSEYCILHTELPPTETPELRRMLSEKDEKIKEKIDNNDFNFEGAQLAVIDLSRMRIATGLNFRRAVINEKARFNNTEIAGNVLLEDAVVRGSMWFEKTTIDGSVLCERFVIEGSVWFGEATIKGGVDFEKAFIHGQAEFSDASIGGSLEFVEAQIGRDATFYKASIGGDVMFQLADIKGELDFEDAHFLMPQAQEEASRRAKQNCKRRGDTEGADYYHYREMEAKRRQKNLITRYLELPFQYIFFYGVYPFRTLGIWLIAVVGFSIEFWHIKGIEGEDSFFAYLYLSIITAITPGYGRFVLKPEMYFWTSIEAVLGAFMWVIFIAILARKYLRS